jgi:hypothetical protein
MKSEYSYFQYHCNPIAFIVIAGAITSSHIYNNMKLGNAIINNITAGNVVHTISINCPWFIYLYAIFELLYTVITFKNMYDTNPNIIHK